MAPPHFRTVRLGPSVLPGPAGSMEDMMQWKKHVKKAIATHQGLDVSVTIVTTKKMRNTNKPYKF